MDSTSMTASVRLARPSDGKPLLKFLGKTLAPGDYVPYLWDSWMSLEDEKTFVVEVAGRAVGLNHMRLLPEGVGWLEGVRIHPEYRGEGLATMLGEHAMEYGRRHGLKKFRLFSARANDRAHRQITRMGFARMSQMLLWKAGPGGKAVEQRVRVREASQSDLKSLGELVEGSEEYAETRGFFGDEWSARSFKEYTLKDLIREGRVRYIDGAKGGVALVVANESVVGKDRFGQVSFGCGDDDVLASLVHSVASNPRDSKGESWYACSGGARGAGRAYVKAGFEKEEDLLLFEKKPSADVR